MKRCVKCGLERPLEEFWKRDGGRRRTSCKTCMASDRRPYYREYNAANAARLREWQRRNYQRHRQTALDRNKRQDGGKVAARRKSRWLCESGKLVRPERCQRCGGAGQRIEMHHADYSRPAEVEWLCSVCHAATRRKVG